MTYLQTSSGERVVLLGLVLLVCQFAETGVEVFAFCAKIEYRSLAMRTGKAILSFRPLAPKLLVCRMSLRFGPDL